MRGLAKAHPAEHRCWATMLSRCYNPNRDNYQHYGGRGITVCDEWRNSFAAFFAHVGLKPTPKHSIDRFPNKNGNYEPGNVRWANQSEQCRNQRDNRIITANGESITLAEWAERTGISKDAIRVRLGLGWTPERAISEPVERGRNQFRGCVTEIDFQGVSKSISEWAKEIGIPAVTLRRRWADGWPVEAVLSKHSFQGTREFIRQENLK